MATLSPSTTPISTTPLKFNPFQKPSQLSLFGSTKTHRFARKVSCKATTPQNHDDDSFNKMDRRNMLLGLGGLYGAATIAAAPPSTLAEPAVLDIKAKCERTVETSDTPGGLNCCPPTINPSEVINFDPKNYPNPITRVRPSAHKVTDGQYLAKFQEAIKLMKALPASDPHSWTHQSNVHCAYCNGAYHQFGHNDKLLQVHFSWLFFPFHRAYLYFFERIVGKMINDPTFAMPYWNWDHPDGMTMPTIYTKNGQANPLFDPLRDQAHQPPRVMDLSFNGKDLNTPNETQIQYNLWHMYIHMVRPRKPELFMGGQYSAGDDIPSLSGSLELLPHNTIHSWTGDPNQKFNENMGTFYSAGKDPIFYAHHANIDRLWSVWKNLDGGRPQFDNSDWLNTYFIFYDENRKPVRIYVRDVLDEKRLGYTNQEMDLPWLEPLKPVADGELGSTPLPPLAEAVKLPKPLGELGFRTKVSRPKKSRSKREKRDKEEVLEVSVDLGDSDKFVKFDVYLNDEHNHSSVGHTKATVSYAGSFTSLPHKSNGKGKNGHKHGRKVRVKMPINEVIEDIGADGDDSVNVVFVARSGQEAVIITDVKIKYH